MTNRFSALDLAAVTTSLAKCVGMRVQNIYDLDRKTFLFKFAASGRKELVLLETGIRIHITNFARERPPVPSVFTMKLRKLLRTKRLEFAEQQGLDRVLILCFGAGDATVKVILEFYAAGNVILVDRNNVILALARSYEYADESKEDGLGKVAVGEVYPLQSTVRTMVNVSKEQLETLVTEGVERVRAFEAGELPEQQEGVDDQKKNKKKKKKKKSPVLRDILNDKLDLGTQLVLNAVLAAGLPKNAPMSAAVDPAVQARLLVALNASVDTLTGLKNGSDDVQEGYVLLVGDEPTDTELYEGVTPLILEQHKGRRTLAFPSFNLACDEFFSRAEAQRVAKQRQLAITQVERHLDVVRKDHQRRLDSLADKQQRTERSAQLMQQHLETVTQALAIVNSAVANKLDWTALGELIKEEKRKGNHIAQLIHALRLEKNEIDVLLYDEGGDESDEDEDDTAAVENEDGSNDEEGSDDEGSEGVEEINAKEDSGLDRQPIVITLDLGLTAHANIRNLYDQRRAATDKRERTEKATVQAIKSPEQHAKKSMEAVHVKAEVLAIRKKYWFEKFRWFVSSDGLIVVGGKEAQQNEMLVRRYLRTHDVFVHADMHGAPAVVVRRPSSLPNTAPIPPVTLAQAGAFAACHSGAWSAKIAHGAWWVRSDQVSKTAPAGEYLSTGGFMIRGKKNFLHPEPLQMGWGVAFVVDEDSATRRRAKKQERLDEMKKRVVPLQEIEGKVEKVEENVKDNVDDHVDDSHDDDDDDMFRISLSTPPAPAAVPDKPDAVEQQQKDDAAREKQQADYQRRKADKEAAQAQKKKNKAANPHANLPRRKLNKIKRMKAKYGEQDEEDFKMAQKLYGVQRIKMPGRDEEPEEVHVEEAEEAEEAAASPGPEDDERAKRCYVCGEEGHMRSACPQKTKNVSDKKEIAALLEEEGLGADGEDGGDEDDSVLDVLVFDPTPEDALMYVIPCCAPYSATGKWKYKRKLIPGALKRGKAVKACVASFATIPGPPREQDLIKALDPNECNAIMMGSVEVARAGGPGKRGGKAGAGAKGKGRGGTRRARGANKRVNRQ